MATSDMTPVIAPERKSVIALPVIFIFCIPLRQQFGIARLAFVKAQEFFEKSSIICCPR